MFFGLFTSIWVALMPPSPQLLEQLKAEGRLQEVVQRLEEARKKGVDAPDPARLQKLRVRIMEAQLQGRSTSVPAIVLLVDFDDNQASTPPAHFDSLLFQYTGGQYSLRDFYLENSYGALEITGEASGWYRMPHNYFYYSQNNGFGSYPNNAQGLVVDAVQAADPYVDFSQYDGDNDGFVDALFVVHAGPGAEETGNPNQIWSHRWVLPSPLLVDGVYVYDYSMEPENGRVGVFVHELGHVFGLPDLYDTDYSSEGLGYWSVMAGGSWGNNGHTPVHFDAWSKVALGFVQPTVVNGTLEDVPLARVEDAPVIYKIWRQNQSGPQYFLVENRRKVFFDAYLPSEGLLIYHVDESQSGNQHEWYPGHTNQGHYKVALEQADGEWDLEHGFGSGDAGDPYPGITGNRRFDNSSLPDSRDYLFQMTHVKVYRISDPGDTMWASFSNDPVPNLTLMDIVAPSGVSFSDSTLHPSIWIGNFGSGNLTSEAQLTILDNGTPIYSATATGPSLAPGDSTLLTFDPFTPPATNVTYQVQAFVTTTADEYSADDTLSTVFTVFQLIDPIVLNGPGSSITVDGILEPSEWADAVQVDISDIMNNGGGTPEDLGTAHLWIKFSDTSLLLGCLVRVNGNSVNFQRLSFYFDDDGSGTFPNQPDDTEGELYLAGNPASPTAYFRPLYATGAGLPQQIPLTYATATTDSTFSAELAIPLVYAPVAENWQLGVMPPSHTLRMFVASRILNPNMGAVGWYPQDVPATGAEDPSGYATVELHNLGVPVEEAERSEDPTLQLSYQWTSRGPEVHLLTPRIGTVNLTLWDATGRLVDRTVLRIRRAAVYRLPMQRLSQGVFFLRVEGAGFKKTLRIPVLR